MFDTKVLKGPFVYFTKFDHKLYRDHGLKNLNSFYILTINKFGYFQIKARPRSPGHCALLVDHTAWQLPSFFYLPAHFFKLLISVTKGA